MKMIKKKVMKKTAGERNMFGCQSRDWLDFTSPPEVREIWRNGRVEQEETIEDYCNSATFPGDTLYEH